MGIDFLDVIVGIEYFDCVPFRGVMADFVMDFFDLGCLVYVEKD